MKATPEQIDRKMRKLARRCAELSTWSDKKSTKTIATFLDVWQEAFSLIKMAGYMGEFEKREKQIQKARM